MHRSRSFAIIIRPHPNLAYHIHGPSKSTPAIWSVKMQVHQNPPLRYGPSKSRSVKIHPRDLVRQNPVLRIPGFEVFWSFKIQSCKFSHPLQISDGVLTDSCQNILGAQKLNFALHFSKKFMVRGGKLAFATTPLSATIGLVAKDRTG